MSDLARSPTILSARKREEEPVIAVVGNPADGNILKPRLFLSYRRCSQLTDPIHHPDSVCPTVQRKRKWARWGRTAPYPTIDKRTDVGGEDQVVSWSFTHYLRKQRVARQWHVTPLSGTTWQRESRRQPPTFEAVQQSLPDRDHRCRHRDEQTVGMLGDPSASFQHAPLKTPQIPTRAAGVFRFAPQHVHQVRGQQRQEQQRFIFGERRRREMRTDRRAKFSQPILERPT